MNDYKVRSYHPDSVINTATTVLVHQETGQVIEVVSNHHINQPDRNMQEVGDRIANGDVKDITPD